MVRFGLGLAIALTVIPGSAVAAQTAKPAEKAQPAGAAPSLPDRKTDKAPAATPAPPATWTPAEIEAARASCTAALKGLAAVVTYEAPIKDGDCGTPAPIRLSKLDNVTFAPAALVNCGMLAPLHTWISRDLQPLARRHLGDKVVSIEVMSDYSCRTAFGRVGKKLSEHAYVDALDLRGFVTAKGQQVSVLEGWGTTSREIAAAKAREEKLVQAAKAAQTGANGNSNSTSNATPVAGTLPPPGLLKPTRTDGIDVVTVILPGGMTKQQPAARLGGPLDRTSLDAKSANGTIGKQPPSVASLSTSSLAPPPSTPRARFLHEAHAAACRIFGTALGPEANAAHRNHFHVDMADRKIKNICE